jgi:hypothetical protein
MKDNINNIDDMIDFNIKPRTSDTPFITETEIIYENDNNKLFQIIGINDTNKCLIKEVGHYSDIKKEYNILIHQMKMKECDIKLNIPIYKMCDINNMRLVILELSIIYENEIIGLYQYCFINEGSNKLLLINGKENETENKGVFIIYDSIDNKIIKKYDKFLNHLYILNELIKYIE